MLNFEFKNRDGKFPKRRKIKIISQYADTMIADIDFADEAIEEGTSLNAEILNAFQQSVNASEKNSSQAMATSELAEKTAKAAQEQVVKMQGTKVKLGDDLAVTLEIGSDLAKKSETEEGYYSLKKSNIVDLIYPVGSIYMSVNAVSPEVMFGGQWEQLKDKFLLGAGSSYSLGATGGESAHTLTPAEMPAHNHTFTGNAVSDAVEFKGIYESRLYVEPQAKSVFTPRGSAISNRVQYTGSGEYPQQKGFDFNYTPTGTIGNTGSGQAHNNMPPYLAVNMWKRIG